MPHRAPDPIEAKRGTEETHAKTAELDAAIRKKRSRATLIALVVAAAVAMAFAGIAVAAGAWLLSSLSGPIGGVSDSPCKPGFHYNPPLLGDGAVGPLCVPNYPPADRPPVD